MLNTRKRAASLVMTAVMLLTTLLPTACASRDAKDTKLIEETVQQFFEAFGSGDKDTLGDIVDEDFSYDLDTRPYSDILIKMASKTELDEVSEVTFNRDKNTAKTKLKISIIDMYDLIEDMGGGFHSEDEYLDGIDSFKKRKTEDLTLNFIYDKDENSWIIKAASANKYKAFFDHPGALPISEIDYEETFTMCLDIVKGFSEGVFEQENFTLDMYSVRVFDDNMFNEPILIEAVNEFTTAYFKYMVDRGINAEKGNEEDYYYIVDVSGTAPSSEQILNYLTSDEHIIEMYMTTIRVSTGTSALTDAELWSSMYAETYFDLAKLIPNMKGEEYRRSFCIDPASVPVSISLCGGQPLNVSSTDVYDLGDIPEDQDIRCQKKAIENLYYAGELSKEQYEGYMADLNKKAGYTLSTIDKPASYDGEFVREVDWSSCGKYKNWATDVNEIIPEGYTGNMIYGVSETDSNRTYMVYGRDQEWMDTFGYCYFNNDFVFLFKLTKPLKGGDRLYYTTVKDGVENNEPRMLVYQDDYNGEFVLRFPDYEFTDNGSIELRLWEDKEMTHLLGYVEVIQT